MFNFPRHFTQRVWLHDRLIGTTSVLLNLFVQIEHCRKSVHVGACIAVQLRVCTKTVDTTTNENVKMGATTYGQTGNREKKLTSQEQNVAFSPVRTSVFSKRVCKFPMKHTLVQHHHLLQVRGIKRQYQPANTTVSTIVRATRTVAQKVSCTAANNERL